MYLRRINDAVRAVRRRGGELHDSQDGLLTLAAAVAVLFFAVVAALVVNVGQVVRQKIAVQNAADASAASAAAVMARGLNAVTAVNHLLGEVTALCVLHEALGGPELDRGITRTTPESMQLDKSNLQLAAESTVETPIVTLSAMGSQDLAIAQSMTDLGGHSAWAAIYDSRITLKQWLNFALTLRKPANALTGFPYTRGIGMLLNGACEAIVQLVRVQSLVLKGIEAVARGCSGPKLMMESTVLPALAKYGEYATKQVPPAAAEAARRAAQSNDVVGFLYPQALQLPIEPQRYRNVTPGGEPPPVPTPREAPFLGDVFEEIKDLMQPAIEIVEWAQDVLDSVPLLSTVADYIEDIAAVKIPGFGNLLLPGNGPPDNVSWKEIQKLSAPAWRELRYGQWVRASYPHVTAWRTPIRKSFGGIMPMAYASKWYSHWTNRYTLIKAYKYSIGDYGGAPGKTKLSMYVMVDPDRRGKGFERWTTDGADAERRFTVVAYAHRKPPAPIAPFLFGSGPPDGIVASAQAIFYNGNPQRPAKPDDGAAFQPDVGWDTLNWRSPAAAGRAYEFLKGEEGGFDPVPPPFPFLTFSRAPNPPQAHLNWQAKLTPLTRLGESWSSTPAAMRPALQKAHDEHDPFRTH